MFNEHDKSTHELDSEANLRILTKHTCRVQVRGSEILIDSQGEGSHGGAPRPWCSKHQC